MYLLQVRPPSGICSVAKLPIALLSFHEQNRLKNSNLKNIAQFFVDFSPPSNFELVRAVGSVQAAVVGHKSGAERAVRHHLLLDRVQRVLGAVAEPQVRIAHHGCIICVIF